LLSCCRHLVAHQVEDLLARLAAPFNQIVHPLLCLLALDVAGAHQFPDDLFGAGACDLAQYRTGIEVLLDPFIACHETRVSGSASC
jgi:hypothetical protein